jgi:hypothetical protein
MAITSRVSSTTQITDLFRRGLEQIWQISVSEMLWHILQYPVSFLIRMMVFPNDSAICGSSFNR